MLNYAPALGNPLLLVECGIARIIVRTHWTNAISERHEVLLDELTDEAVLGRLLALNLERAARATAALPSTAKQGRRI